MSAIKLFKDKTFYRNLWAVAIPISLQSLVNASVNMLDTVMVGRLGTVEIAAVGLGNQVFFLYMLILFGICSGGSVFTAQFWGKRDIAGIRYTTGLCLLLALAVAAVFTFACLAFPSFLIGLFSADPAVVSAGGAYLRTLAPAFAPFAVSFALTMIMRSVERVRLPMIATFVSLSINATLNWLLIFGVGPFPALGVVGAAAATVVSRVVEACILVIVSYRRSYPFAGSLRELFDFSAAGSAFVRRFLRIASPVMANELVWSLGINMQNLIMARTGTEAIAAFNILNTVSQLTWVLFMGLGNGAGVLIGKKIGEGDAPMAREYAGRVVRFAPLLAAAVALLLAPLWLILPFLFNADPLVFSALGPMFAILALAYPFRAFNMTMIIGVCRAGGDTVFCAVYDVLLMWTVSLPAAAAASFLFGAPVPVVFLFLALEDPLKMVLGLWRLRTGRWLHDVTGKR